MTTQQFFGGGGGTGVFGQGNAGGNTSISKTIAQAKLRKQRQNRGNSNNAAHHTRANDSFSGAEYASNANAFNQTNYNSFGAGGGVGHVRKASYVGGYTGGNLNNLNAQFNLNNFSGNNQNNGNLTAISGGRKPTADSHAYTLYKPNKGVHAHRGKFSNGGGSMAGADGYDGYGVTAHGAKKAYVHSGREEKHSFGTNPKTTATRFYNPKGSHGGSPVQMNNLMGDTQSRFMEN